jgi:hypothetical protein
MLFSEYQDNQAQMPPKEHEWFNPKKWLASKNID